MMVDRFANEAGAILDGAIDDEQTSILVDDASSFPVAPFRVRIGDEFLRVTELAGETFTVDRGIEGSTAAAHDNGAEVWHVLTAGAVTAIRDDLQAHSNPYTIALIPDTQNLTSDSTNAAHFQALADHLTANAEPLGLDLILHLGDVVTSASTTTYDRAKGPMEDIRDIGVPFLAAIGNHDYDPTGGASGDHEDHDDTTLWNTYFGPAFYGSPAWWGDIKDSGRSENAYITPIVGGRPTLVLSLETFPRQATMEWANDVVADHPYHDVIVITHSFMFIDGTRTEDTDADGPDAYAVTDAISGEDMWQGWLKDWRNLKLVASGHHLTEHLSHRVDYGTHGNAVWQQFQNWQQIGQGGDGRVVLMTINPQTGATFRRVFNPRQDEFDTSTGYELALTLDQQQVDISALEAALDIDPGNGNGGSEPPELTAIRGIAEIEDPATNTDVEHTAPQLPQRGEIQVTPASPLFDASQFWVSNIGEETFRINLDVAPGNSDIVEFDWLYMMANDASFTIEAFTENGTWNWAEAGEPETVEVLVVAGGGGGGGYFSGGGGGAGGVLYDDAFAVTENVSVVVGSGGDGGIGSDDGAPGTDVVGDDGGDSEFGALVATGGGGGGGSHSGLSGGSYMPGRPGGSGGGGGGRDNTAGGSGTSEQGNAGGNARNSNTGGTGGGGGGGGASEVGESIGGENRGGDGGDGTQFPQFADYGESGWFGGGGGGGTIAGSTPGSGGNGGGGNGNQGVGANGFAATANTGGGGGGGGNEGSNGGAGGDGGSGIVLVRYPSPS